MRQSRMLLLAGLLASVVNCRDLYAQDQTAGWKRVKAFKDGTSIMNFVDVDSSWKQLQFKWNCPCDAERTMLLTARGGERGAPPLGRERINIEPEGDVVFPLPDGTVNVTISMYGKHCRSSMEMEVLAPITSAKAVSNLDFRATRWGMSKAEVIAGEGSPASESQGRLTYVQQLAGLKSALYFDFIGGKLETAEYNLLEQSLDPSQSLISGTVWLEALRVKYGEPKQDTRWLNDRYRNDESKYALAIASGDVIVTSSWRTERTRVAYILSGKEGVLSVRIQYTRGL